MSNRTSNRGRSRSFRQHRLIVIGLLLVVSLLLPSTALGGADEPDPSEPPQAEEPSAEVPSESPIASTEPIPAASEDPLDDNVALPSDPAAQLPGETGGIVVDKYWCPDRLRGDQAQLALHCAQGPSPVSPVLFQVFGPNLSGNYENGFAQEGLGAGDYRISESLPGGYSEPSVFCSLTAGPASGAEKQEVITYDGVYEFALGAGQYLDCDWYNVPIQPTGTATVLVNKHFCPAPTEEFDAYDADIYELAAECQEPATPANFTVEREDGTEVASGTAEGAPDYLELGNLPPDIVSVVEEIPAGYDVPIVYCSVNDELGNDRVPGELKNVDNDRITLDLVSGDVVFCDWFNVPADRGVSISVVKITCEDHVGPDYGGYDDYAETCTETTEGISFKLDSESTGNPGNQATDANGQVSWDGLEADTYSITEQGYDPEYAEDNDIPDDSLSGYGTPVVYCAFYLPNALETERQYESYPVTEREGEYRIEFEIEDGQFITCVWFNIPPREGATLTVVKYTCPEWVGEGHGGYDAYVEDCPDATEGISFKLDGESTGNPGNQTTDEDGRASWSRLESDTYYLTEQGFDPEYEDEADDAYEYGTPAVYCASYLPGSPESDREYDPYEVEVREGEYRISFELDDERDHVCVWFNVSEDGGHSSPSASATPTSSPSGSARPSATGSVNATSTPRANGPATGTATAEASGPATLTIRVHGCEAGYDLYAAVADPEGDCEDRPEDVTFELTAVGDDGAETRRATTGEDEPGEATFEDVDPATYRLAHLDISADATAFILGCESDRRDFSEYPAWPFALVAADGSVQIDLLAGETLACDWYDVPGDGLTIRVYDCAGDEPSEEDCEPASEPVRFVLTPVEGQELPVSVESDATGTAYVSGLEGSYTLSQVGQLPCGVESADIDEDGNLTLVADRETTVEVYNCA